MTMHKNQIEPKIASAVEEMVPKDAFERISKRIVPAQQQERTRIEMKKKNLFLRIALPAVAACMALAIGISGFSYYNRNLAVDSIIDIDVNPGIELTTNSQDRVLVVTAVNDDAVAILDGMDLSKTDLKVAVNAIIGSMVQKGYVMDETSGILVTVQNEDVLKAENLRNEILADIDTSLTQYNINAPVINQTVTTGVADAEQFAKDNGISLGKAIFVLNLVAKDTTLNARDLAKMSIKDITATVVDKKLDIRDIVDYDADDSIWENIYDTIEDVNEEAYENELLTSTELIGLAKAKEIALQHAGVSAADTFIRAELGEDDGVPEYEIEFRKDNIEYEYEIHAKTGAILSAEKDREGMAINNTPTNTTPSTTPSGSAELIDAEKAKEIALNHAGIAAADAAFLKAELDYDDGTPAYDIEFRNGLMEYEYEINAETGAILKAEKDIDE